MLPLGTQEVPAVAPFSQSRTGFFFVQDPETGEIREVGITLEGWETFRFGCYGFRFRSGEKTGTLEAPALSSTATWTLPDSSGTLARDQDYRHTRDVVLENTGLSEIWIGQPVTAVSGGVRLSEPDEIPIGLAVETIPAGESGKIRTSGNLSQPDWTAVTGSSLLTPGGLYGITGTGTVTLDAGDPVFQALDTTTVKVSGIGGGGSGQIPHEEVFISDGTSRIFTLTGWECVPENTQVWLNGLYQDPAKHVTIEATQVEFHHTMKSGWRIQVRGEEA